MQPAHFAMRHYSAAVGDLCSGLRRTADGAFCSFRCCGLGLAQRVVRAMVGTVLLLGAVTMAGVVAAAGRSIAAVAVVVGGCAESVAVLVVSESSGVAW